jgi:tyrocidine synthetase-2
MKENGFCEGQFPGTKINGAYYEEMDYPGNKTLAELFCEQAQNSPDNPALIFDQKKLSYAELDEKTNVLANILRNLGVDRNVIVGVLCEQSPELILGMLATLKAGGAFLILDPHYPKDRINFLLENSETAILLAKTAYLEGVAFKNQIFHLDALADRCDAPGHFEGMNESSDLAFIVYTSGTTGTPKAAMIEHRNSVNAAYYIKSRLSVDSSARIIQFFNPCFSVSYQEIFVTLLSGGALYIINESVKRDIEKLFDFISKEEINILFLPSSVLRLIMSENKYLQRMPPSIKQIITAGEQLIFSDGFMKYLTDHGVECYNNYGTSETNIATIHKVKASNPLNQFVPIGKPIANTRVYILNENLELQPLEKEGEIYISGDSVGRGYLNNPGLTGEKFIKNPFIDGKIMYRTGDLGKWLPDGNIQLLGRTDYQVKVRGFRIELEEIEYHLLKHPLIKEAAVVAKRGNDDGSFLYAYVLTDKPIPPEEIKRFLSSKIPEYMMPAYIIRLNGLPKTPAGKIDRKALIENRTVLLNEDEIRSCGSGHSAEIAVILNEIKIILEAITGSELVNISPEDDFAKLGLDSISFIKLMADIENKFGIEFEDEILNNNSCKCVKELISCVEEKVRI